MFTATCFAFPKSKVKIASSTREEKRKSKIQDRFRSRLQDDRRTAAVERARSVEPLGEIRLRLVEETLEVCIKKEGGK